MTVTAAEQPAILSLQDREDSNYPHPTFPSMIFISTPSIWLPLRPGQNRWDGRCTTPRCSHHLSCRTAKASSGLTLPWPPLVSQGLDQGCLEPAGGGEAGLPVGVLCTHVHLQEDPLGERLKALPTLPQVPVTELRVQLAGGGGAGEHSLVLHVHLVKA